jgi:co-chaperonin GroES (HSP10)
MIQATNKNYIIKSVEQETQTAGGLFIKQSDQTQLAQVVSVGPDVEHPIAIDSKIVVNWNAAMNIKVKDTHVFVIHADHVLGVVSGS